MSDVRQEQNIVIRNATAIAIAAVTALMLAAAVVFWRQGEANREAKGWVIHTYDVTEHIQSLFGLLKDAELGQRGFSLTGDPRYLEPYQAALEDVPIRSPSSGTLNQRRSIGQELAFIRQLTADNPSQQSNLDEMEDSVTRLLSFMAHAVENRQANSTAPLDAATGKQLMDKCRSLVRIMMSEEGHLLALRNATAGASEEQANWTTYWAIGIFYVLMTISIALYQRSQARARAQMLRYTQELERREEELKAQQEELKAQQEELKASNEEIAATNEELEEKTRALEEQNKRIRLQSNEIEEAKSLIEEKATELEAASRYKSEFLANMSHELRTPLNSLLILARGLAANEEGNLTEEQIEEARVIHNGGLELLSLINDILDLSKVEAGKISIVPEDVFLADVVKRLVQQFEPIAKDRSVPLEVRIDESLPHELRTDAQRVEQILKNLLSNAFKFTQTGSVTLEVKRCAPGQGPQNVQLAEQDTVSFAVIDTGIGIEASKVKDIFEAFQQENGSIDRQYGGTGLGLTIARKFAHLLGGEIQVKSVKGKGSTFTLYLPLAPAERASEESEPAPVQPALSASTGRTALRAMPKASIGSFVADDRAGIGPNDKVLLIIEDDPGFAATLIKVGRKRGYKCLAAGTGKSGLLLACEQPVTAILLDLLLPDIDGPLVLDQLKHDLKTRHIPVHIVSGREDADAITLMSKGALGLLTKPISGEDINTVFSRLEQVLKAEVKRVLVIEDDKSTQIAIGHLLGQKDLEITAVSSGRAAYDKLKSTRFDCVILDLKLPDMSGFEWLEAFEKETGLGEPPPVIVYTAKELTEDEHRQLRSHTGSIVIKGASSSERLLDEVTLFLHSVESTLSEAQQAVIRMQHDPDRVLQRQTVLLVDDDLRNTFALSKLLKRHGMDVVIADNGQMALEKLNENPQVGLVVMDIMMPIMDGYQCIRAIRGRAAWKALPIIALTARAMPEEQERCLEAGANDYLVKPVDVERLLTLMRLLLFRQELAA